jgi:hypothetical protein
LYDLSFLLMDLHVRGHDDLCNAVFNTYLDHAPETDGLRALPLFLSLRAATRSYALAGAAMRSTVSDDVERLRARAHLHIASAGDFLKPRAPIAVLLGGADDHDRAQTAVRLAPILRPAPGARILRLASTGQSVWRAAAAVLTTGCSVLLEGTWSDNECRFALEAFPRDVELVRLWLGRDPPDDTFGCWQQLDSASNASYDSLINACNYRLPNIAENH